MPIMNPLDSDMTGTVRAFEVLKGLDGGAQNYIDIYADYSPSASSAALCSKSGKAVSAEEFTLYDCVIKGFSAKVKEAAQKELAGKDPMEIINSVLIPALQDVGNLYDRGKIFLPQLISSAEAAKAAFAVVTEFLPRGLSEKGTVVLATVKGDVHDIGKNIVKVVLESYGYSVADLGKDVPEQEIVAAVKKYSPIAVGLSALMTTTVASMKKTIAALRDSGCSAPIFVGGAVLTADIASAIGADYYTKDALEFVKVLETV